jgi:hypothetical protein
MTKQTIPKFTLTKTCRGCWSRSGVKHIFAALVCWPSLTIANEPLDAETIKQEQLQLLEFLDMEEMQL